MFLFCPLPTEAERLLDTNFLEINSGDINFECGKMPLAAIDKATYAYSVTPQRALQSPYSLRTKQDVGLSPHGARSCIQMGSTQATPAQR